MLLAGTVLAALGTVGVFTAVAMEVKTHEPRWKLLMKVTPWLVGLGMFLIGLSFAMGG